MSEQLTLGGELNSTREEKAKRVKRTADLDVDSRINRLLEKSKQDAANAAAKAATASTITEEAAAPAPPKSPLASAPVSSGVGDGMSQPAVQSNSEPVATSEQKPQVLSISELNRAIKGNLEKAFPLIWVKGEISNFKMPGSGHMYFTLKDETAQIRAVMFRGFTQALKFRPEDGMEVLVRCRVTVYEPRGDYQVFCEHMEPMGFGALQIAFEKLKAQLQKEGLFDQARKRQLPAFPKRIGIITSPTGAAIRDMLNVLSRRSGGGLSITVIPTSVQGDKAPAEIVAALELANRLGPDRFDVLIVGRGGGSIEDMWSFNTESVVRAVAASRIPTISAVGHEVDFTICDFVADLRAPTPSAAAELVVKNKADLVERIKLLGRSQTQLIVRRIQLARAASLGLQKRLIDPKRKLQDLMLRCDEWSDRLINSIQRYISDRTVEVKFLRERLGSPDKRLVLTHQRLITQADRLRAAIEKSIELAKTRLGKHAVLLNGLSPLAVLDRGYSILKHQGVIVKDSAQLKAGDEVDVRLAKGDVKAEIL